MSSASKRFAPRKRVSKAAQAIKDNLLAFSDWYKSKGKPDTPKTAGKRAREPEAGLSSSISQPRAGKSQKTCPGQVWLNSTSIVPPFTHALYLVFNGF